MSISEDEKLSQMIKDCIDLSSTVTDSCFFPIELGSTVTDSCLCPPSQPLQVDDHPIYFSLQVLYIYFLFANPHFLCVCVCFSLQSLVDRVYIYVCTVCFQEIMEETPDAETEVYGKILFYLKDMESMEKLNKLKKWIVFRLEMDNYEAHLCKTSWSTPFGPPSGTYTFSLNFLGLFLSAIFVFGQFLEKGFYIVLTVS